MRLHDDLAVFVVLVAACGGPAVASDQTSGGSTADLGGDSTSTSSGTGSTDATETTTTGSESGDSSGAMPPDLGDDLPPLPTSRIVVDVETPRGHALMLHEIVDGEPRPATQLTEDAPSTTSFALTSLGASDRVALVVRYGSGIHDLFLVDWSAGHPATVTQLDADVSSADIGPLVWIAELDAIVARIGYSYYRIDVTDAGASPPIDLLDDVPFAVELDDNQWQFVMPVGPWLAALSDGAAPNLYAADITDPDVPTERVTDFDGTSFEVSVPYQLAGEHIVYEAYTLSGLPDQPPQVHVIPRLGDAWADPLRIAPPTHLPDASCSIAALRPHSDEIVYGVSTTATSLLMSTRVEDSTLGEPTLLHEGPTSWHLFAPDGSRLVYVDDTTESLAVVTFTPAGPSRPQPLDATLPRGTEWWLPRTITSDGEQLYVEAHSSDPPQVNAVLRVALDGDAPAEVVAGDAEIQQIREYALAPDERWLAFTTASVVGLTTYIVDVSGAEPGEPLQADHGDAPIMHELLPSPDSHWLATTTGHGSGADTVVVTRRDDPGAGVLAVTDLVGDPVWLP